MHRIVNSVTIDLYGIREDFFAYWKQYGLDPRTGEELEDAPCEIKIKKETWQKSEPSATNEKEEVKTAE